MDNPEIQSSQFASTMEDPDFHESFSSDYSEDEVDWLAYSEDEDEDEDEDEVEDKVKDEVDWIAKARRRGRKTAAKEFRKEYFYGRCKDEKTCISPNGHLCRGLKGMDNPEIQSSQSTSTMEDPVTMSESDFHEPMYEEDKDKYIAKVRRRGRKTSAEVFREEYFYGRCNDEKTCIWPNGCVSWLEDSSGITWVGVHGNDSICVVTKAVDLDLTRVHGFLVFRTKEEVLRDFRRTVISEIEVLVDPEDSEDSEDLADSDSELREMFRKSIQKPFGVVSVVPLNEKVHKASSGEYQESKHVKFLLESLDREENGEQTSSDDDDEIDSDDEDARIKYSIKLSRRRRRIMPSVLPVPAGYDEKKTIRFLKKEMERDASITNNEAVQESSDEYDEETAIDFLQEKLKGGEDFTLNRTVQTAISAFELLFKKKFKANEIEVCVMDPKYFVSIKEVYIKDIYVKHLETSEIEHILADMNEPGSGGSSSEGSSRGGSPMSSDGGGSSSGGSPMSSDGSY